MKILGLKRLTEDPKVLLIPGLPQMWKEGNGLKDIKGSNNGLTTIAASPILRHSHPDLWPLTSASPPVLRHSHLHLWPLLFLSSSSHPDLWPRPLFLLSSSTATLTSELLLGNSIGCNAAAKRTKPEKEAEEILAGLLWVLTACLWLEMNLGLRSVHLEKPEVEKQGCSNCWICSNFLVAF